MALFIYDHPKSPERFLPKNTKVRDKKKKKASAAESAISLPISVHIKFFYVLRHSML